MKQLFITEVEQSLLSILDNAQMKALHEALTHALWGKNIVEVDSAIEQPEAQSNAQLLEMFLSAKRVEGCSEKTLHYYQTTIAKLLHTLDKRVVHITTDDLRQYLADYQQASGCSRGNIDNIRRILSSFFAWLEDEDYIVKSPVRRIHRIKTAKIIKEAFTDETIEVLRDTCSEVRNLAMVELLASSGMRVGELVKLNRTDINFNERSCIVFGKGSSEREVYFDARTKIHLWQYLNSRTDDNPALFVSLRSPHKRLEIGGVEFLLRKLGRIAAIENVHPHRFRRTLATRAIDKGMPIEQVQRLLGHKKIDTTMCYALVNQSNVKIAHRRYVG